MNWQIVGLLQLPVVGAVIGIVSASNSARMIEEINRSPERRKTFAPYGLWIGKVVAIRDEHRRLFPQSHRLGRQNAYVATAALSFLIAVAALSS